MHSNPTSLFLHPVLNRLPCLSNALINGPLAILNTFSDLPHAILNLLPNHHMRLGHGGDLPFVLPDEVGDVPGRVGEKAPRCSRCGEERSKQTDGPDPAAGQNGRSHGSDGYINEPGEHLLARLAGRCKRRNGARHRLLRVEVLAQVAVELPMQRRILLVDV